MQKEGFSQFTQLVSGIMKNNTHMQSDQKAEKLATILQLCTNCGIGRVSRKSQSKVEENKEEDVDMIDSL
jgi:hypothetical protein